MYCWNHLITDLRWHLRDKCSCSAEETNHFVNAFKSIQANNSEVENGINEMFIKRPKITKYFEENFIPAFKTHGPSGNSLLFGMPARKGVGSISHLAMMTKLQEFHQPKWALPTTHRNP